MIKKYFLPVFLLIITLNGWATGRFSVYINGHKSGEVIVKRTINKNIVVTETSEKLVLKRGTSTIETETIYLCTEKKDGTPVELKVRNTKGNTSLFPEYTVKFGKEIKLILPQGTKTLTGQTDKIRQDYGEEILLKKMIEKGIKKLTYSKFDPTILNIDNITAEFTGKNKLGYKFKLTSAALNITEERIVDKNGKMLVSTTKFAGMEFKAVKTSLEKKEEKLAPAQVFTPSLIPLNYFLPKGYTVKSITYKLSNKSEYSFSKLGSENQKVKQIDKKSCLLTVVRAKIPENATADNDTEYLKSSRPINLENPKLNKIVATLKNRSKNTYEFIKNTLNFVYNYITIKNFDNLMADTDTILNEKKGDCTEHSFLATAILRKNGIPARCVMGLVMGDNIFGYHMWVEAKLNGRWFPIDPTFNQISPDPTHIKLGEFPDNLSNLKEVYSKVLPLIQSLSLNPIEVEFFNGKKIPMPDKFFKQLFKGEKWGFDTQYFMHYLTRKEGIFNEKIYLFSITEKDPRILARRFAMFSKWKHHYTQEIKGMQTLVFLDRNKFSFSFVHNSVLVIFVAQSTRPVKIEKLKDFCYNKCIEVIDKCRKKF